MIQKDFDAIGKEDIDALIANAVCESRTIEYKELLPGGADEDRREFLADASSFANAVGGDLIFGVVEKRDVNGKATGIPEIVNGLTGINPDAEKRRLEDMLRSGIDPRIPSIRIKHIDGFSTGPVILLRITKSWASPHMVTFKNVTRFYSRTSAGKHQLDVREIRALFLASENLSARMTAFRSDRVAKILSDETPLRLEAGPRLILHLLPVRSFNETVSVDFQVAQLLPHQQFLPMGTSQASEPRFNFDGYLVPAEWETPPQCYSYVQLFRNGVVEAVWSNVSRDQELLIGPIEREITQAVPRYAQLQQKLGIEPPLFVTISLTGIKGMKIVTKFRFENDRYSKSIDRDVLLTPEILVEESGANIIELLRPALDTIWQASGWARSLGYDQKGKRLGTSAFDS